MAATAFQRRARIQRVLREFRLARGLRQEDLAERLGRPQSYVSRYEAGERVLDIVELIELCDALEVRFADMAKKIEEVS